MSLPLLTPLDTPIFDEDVIAEMEEHFDDVVPCLPDDCGEPAVLLLANRCCSAGITVCARHYARCRAWWAVFVLLHRHSMTCISCGHVCTAGTPFEEAFKEVPL